MASAKKAKKNMEPVGHATLPVGWWPLERLRVNAPHDISAFALYGDMFDWREIINGAVFLTTNNAQAQATLLLWPEKIVRLEPLGDAAKIDLEDFKNAKAQLPPLATEDFEANKTDITQFFEQGRAASPLLHHRLGQERELSRHTQMRS